MLLNNYKYFTNLKRKYILELIWGLKQVSYVYIHSRFYTHFKKSNITYTHTHIFVHVNQNKKN